MENILENINCGSSHNNHPSESAACKFSIFHCNLLDGKIVTKVSTEILEKTFRRSEIHTT